MNNVSDNTPATFWALFAKGSPQVRRILLTNDLTEPVLSEAVEEKVDMVVSYHPPLFRPLKRLTKGNWKERVR